MAQLRFETAIPESKRLQTHCFDRAATGIGHLLISGSKLIISNALEEKGVGLWDYS